MNTTIAHRFEWPERAPTAIRRNGSRLEIFWTSGEQMSTPLVWLRDNCPCDQCRIVETSEHRYFLGSSAEIPDAISIQLDAGTISISWSDAHVSRFSGEQLRHLHHVAARKHRPAQPWSTPFSPSTHEHRPVLAETEARLRFLRQLIDDGVVIVANTPTLPGECARFIEAVGAPVRATPFDRVHDVRFDPDGYNVAHSSEALPPHTDFASYQWPPSGQVLHMLRNEATGGDSLIVDGLAVAHELRRDHPDAFEVLSRVLVPFREHSASAESWTRAPLIRVDAEGYAVGIRYSNQLMLPLPPADNDVEDFYRAYHVLSRALVDRQNQIRFRLEAGQMLILHSHRVLHGRDAYNRHAGPRHLQDTYFEFDDIMSEAARLGEEIP